MADSVKVLDSFNDLFAEIEAGISEPSGEEQPEVEAADGASDEEQEEGQGEEQEELEAEGEGESVDEPKEEPQVSPRANQRIQQLIEDRKELQSQLTQQQQQFQEALQQQQQRTEQLVQGLMQKLTPQQEEAEDLSEGEKWERKFEKRLVDKLNPDKVGQLEQQVQQLTQYLERERQAKVMREKLGKFSHLAQEAARKVVLEGLEPEDVEALSETTMDLVMRGASAHRKMPNETAPKTRQFLDAYYKARKKAERQANKRKVEAAKGPTSPGVSKTAGTAADTKGVRKTVSQMTKQQRQSGDWLSAIFG